MLETFEKFEVVRDGVRLNARSGGRGEPLLLLHGHPQSHAMWHRVAPALAEEFTVVMMDLRGYGDSGRPEPGEGSRAYAKREMALDALVVMQARGYSRFRVLAHDRGARVAHRLAADHPQSVDRLMLLDIAPTLAMYERTSLAFAQAYWHWFFLIQ
ncbi:MAG: putative haloacetate dehalogenase, partial [Ramlibacter sp.]|nr:putative haloacetate dehalogenase [Ramlibacter sp.]